MVEPQGPAGGGLYALSRDTLLVRGADRKTWLDGLLTCAVTNITVGSAGYGLLLTKQGKIVTDAFLADTGSELLVGVAPGRGAAVRELLDRYLVMEDAELEQPTAPLQWRIALREAAADGGVLAHGTLVLGPLQAELSVAHAGSEPLPDGAELLAEHGLGAFGVDFSERDNPHEASLDRIAVSWTKGCYLGQEVVCMQDMRGKVKRRLVALDGSAALLAWSPEPGAPPPNVLATDGSVAGHVSSVHRAPAGARVLASISTSALESRAELSVLGEPLRVAFGVTSNLS
jgi:tRNA-modifying protein YgfZ